SSRPARTTPRTTAVIAGSAPRAAMAARMRASASRFCGIGRPCASTELSRATRGRPATRAAWTAALSATASSGVVEIVRATGLDEVPLACLGIVHGQELDRLAGVAVERLPGASLDDDLVAVLELEHDVRIL